MRFKQLFIIHIITWVFYFGGTGYYIDTYWYNQSGDKQMYWFIWAASRFWDFTFTYIVSELILQKFLVTRKYLWFFLTFIPICFFHYAYDTYVWNCFYWDKFWFAASIEQRVEIAGNTIQMLLIAFIFFASKNWVRSVFQRKKLEDEVAQTELKFLKSQMSPHFLFNVFNNIYSLSLDENQNTHKAISQLKSIMNYIQIFEGKSEISLTDEEHHLQDYIALNRLRYSAKVRLKSSFQNPEYTIEPMIFLPFFENAFKHGKTGGNDEIRALIKEKYGIVNFEISNDVDPQKRKDSVSGVGLENIKKRLPYLYRGFWMDVMQDEGKYKVKVRINLGKKVKL